MKHDRIAGILLIVFAAFIYWQSCRLPEPLLQDKLGPDALPKLYAIILGSLGLIISAKGFFKATEKNKRISPDWKTWWHDYRFVVFSFVMFFVYIQAMKYAGFLIATLLYLPAMMLVIGSRNKKSVLTAVITTACVTLGIFFSFTYLLNIFLPSGTVF